ncbi:MAG: alanine--tRNA ligase [Patescibacteria group bacterium]
MTSKEIKEKYLDFFKNKGHTQISPAQLVLEGDPTTLFTSSGMQPLVPYFKGEKHPAGKRLVDYQPSLRLQDIDEVGDNRHTTFFEMLGNWSLGDYWKKEQLSWVFEFLTKELKIPLEKLCFSVFEGTKDIPRDDDSFETWISLGVPKEKIFFYGVDKNWWSRSGSPNEMPIGEIGGPDSEIFYDFGEEYEFHEKYIGKNKPCHPNCDCGRYLEIGNSVFIQYEKQSDGSLKELAQKSVDFGGGLERITMAVKDEPDIYKIDLFLPIINQLEDRLEIKYGSSEETTKSLRIIADHIKASTFLISEGVKPGNKLQEYILRRLLRRSALKTYRLKEGFDSKDFKALADTIIQIYPDYFKNANKKEIVSEVSLEMQKFRYSIGKGYKESEKYSIFTGKIAFDLFQTHGFPLELTEEIAEEKGQKIDKKVFEEEFEKHKQQSRNTSVGMFKGGLSDASEDVTKLHTTTHLLHKALRIVLGKSVQQKGSNITSERLRFDFTCNQKLSDEEIKKVEKIINEQIEKDLPVTFETKSSNEAKNEGALAFFGEKYGEKVKVYIVGDPKGNWYSKEVCGGPHVSSTKNIGRVKIIKQEKVGAGIVRIYATNK